MGGAGQGSGPPEERAVRRSARCRTSGIPRSQQESQGITAFPRRPKCRIQEFETVNPTTLLTIFVAVAAVAMTIQMIILYALYKAVSGTAAKVESLVVKVSNSWILHFGLRGKAVMPWDS